MASRRILTEDLARGGALCLRAGGGPAWWFEPKWDGFRCLAFRAGGKVRLQAKSGKSLDKYFPEMVERLRNITVDPLSSMENC
jgi:ATP-dependent DNA ligase